MPVYEFACRSCGEHFDKRFSFSQRVPKSIACPNCRSRRTRRVLSLPAAHASDVVGVSDASNEPVADLPKLLGRKEIGDIARNKRRL